MGLWHGGRDGGNGLLVTAVLVVCGALAAAIAVAAGWLRLGSSGAPAVAGQTAAAQRCEADVMGRLVAPERASIADLRTEDSSLDLDGRDMFPVTLDDPLKGVDTARITVLNVSGVVNGENELGYVIQDHFDCRAYFVDGTLAHTLVVFQDAH